MLPFALCSCPPVCPFGRGLHSPYVVSLHQPTPLFGGPSNTRDSSLHPATQVGVDIDISQTHVPSPLFTYTPEYAPWVQVFPAQFPLVGFAASTQLVVCAKTTLGNENVITGINIITATKIIGSNFILFIILYCSSFVFILLAVDGECGRHSDARHGKAIGTRNESGV